MYLLSVPHPFAAHLEDWEQGVPVDCGSAWSDDAISIAVQRGAHPTVRTPDAIELVHEDIEYQVKAGFSEVLLWDDIKHCLHANFKISHRWWWCLNQTDGDGSYLTCHSQYGGKTSR
jgi:hypothetical protein